MRSFGEDPQEVARFVAAFVRGVQSAGVIATVKHFPGHGDTHTDSHRSLPVLAASRERLERMELVPFRAAIARGGSGGDDGAHRRSGAGRDAGSAAARRASGEPLRAEGGRRDARRHGAGFTLSPRRRKACSDAISASTGSS